MYLAANGDPAASSERPRWDLESNTTALVTFLEHCPADHLVYRVVWRRVRRPDRVR